MRGPCFWHSLFDFGVSCLVEAVIQDVDDFQERELLAQDKDAGKCCELEHEDRRIYRNKTLAHKTDIGSGRLQIPEKHYANPVQSFRRPR